MSTLSREQVDRLSVLFKQGKWSLGDNDEAWAIIEQFTAHDAAQRALLRQREEALERTKELLQRRSRIGDEDRALALDLRAQLAAVTAERDRKSGLIKDLTQTLKNRNEQLAASQSRCAQLEKALRHILEIDETRAGALEMKWKAQCALTPTERTPA